MISGKFHTKSFGVEKKTTLVTQVKKYIDSLIDRDWETVDSLRLAETEGVQLSQVVDCFLKVLPGFSTKTRCGITSSW